MTEHQEIIPEAVTTVLKDADPGTWVVIPVAALTVQLKAAIEETMASDRKTARPGRAAVQFLRTVDQLGWTVQVRQAPLRFDPTTGEVLT